MNLTPRVKRLGPVDFDELMKHAQVRGECLVWHGHRNPAGLPTYLINPKYPTSGLSAARLFYRFLRHEVRGNQHVWNTCRNPMCVTSEHKSLRRADQIAALPHTQAIGQAHHRSKLTDLKVRDIRAAYASGGLTYSQIAQDFGVSIASIGKVISGKSWSHVTD